MQEQNNKTQIEEVLEIVSFIKDHAASHEDVNRLETRMDSLETRMDSLETKVVTKDYLDDKLADLRGDLVVLMRKEDIKVRTLVEIMLGKQLLSKEEANKV
jgi:hypothetical protein